MGLHNCLANSQTESCSLTMLRRFATVELVENPPLIARRDSLPAIADFDGASAAIRSGANLQLRFGRRVLDGVVQQIDENLLHQQAVHRKKR